VATSSTKSNPNTKRKSSAGGGASKTLGSDYPSSESQISDRTWRIAAISIFLLAVLLRVYDLNLVPLHHDEGVNGNFLVTLVREGRYRYDPANYHGPTLYYFTAVFPWAIKAVFGAAARDKYGLNTVVIRLLTSLFGIATIYLVFLLKRNLGAIATLVAALLLAISPGAVYLSRYYIHETLFVFFTLGIVVAVLRFFEQRNPVYLLLASASAAMLFATKETAMISAGVLLIALASTLIYRKLLVQSGGKTVGLADGVRRVVERLGGSGLTIVWIFLAILLFVGLNVIFYSSFFRNYPQGVYDSLATFNIWSKTGKSAHVHPPNTYLEWLFKQESGPFLLGALGALLIVFKPKNAFALFCGLWAFGLIAAYSLVPYKTPWLALNFILPLTLIAGYGIQAIYELERGKLRLPAVLLGLALLVGIYQTIDLNFFNYDNDSTYYVYVYAHTKRGTQELLNQIDKLAATKEGSRTGITIVSRDYWPLPWYLRDYTRVGYYGKMTQTNEPLIVASEDQKAEMESNFGALYSQVPSKETDGSYPLRPGVDLLLYLRNSNVPE
jgi:uncharacterized protein (TIGR03663 family)